MKFRTQQITSGCQIGVSETDPIQVHLKYTEGKPKLKPLGSLERCQGPPKDPPRAPKMASNMLDYIVLKQYQSSGEVFTSFWIQSTTQLIPE